MEQIQSDFEIKVENKNKALEAIKKLASGEPGFSHNYRWFQNEDFENFLNLKEAMNKWRWEIEEDEDGNVYYIHFIGEKSGDDDILFNAIAPFVEEGSFIQMLGEEGEMWRWVFNDEKCIEIYPTIIWEDV